MTSVYPLAPLVNRLTVTEPQTTLGAYYRSKLFSTPNSNNPILSAASPLFSLTGRLSIACVLPPIDSLRENIEHELHAFHSKLQVANYSSELIILARYLLCATIDELLGKSYLRLQAQPAQFQAFTPLSNDGIEPQERFFEIVHYVKERPNQYLDVIELAWFCLISGFEGKEHLNANGRQTLDNLIEDLYVIIQKHRVNKPQTLFNTPVMLTNTDRYYHFPVILSTITTITMLVVLLCITQIFLNTQANHLQQTHLAFNEED